MCTCRFRIEKQDEMPFKRTLATNFYDGPTEGFTECAICGQTYAFRMLDWDDAQDVRILAFATIPASLDEIRQSIVPKEVQSQPFILVPPLPLKSANFVKALLAYEPDWVAAIKGWPGHLLAEREVSKVKINDVNDWFSFIGIEKNRS